MNPSVWLLQAVCSPLSLAIALIVKWWATWFILGQNFTRTSLLSILALAGTYGLSWIVLQSGAFGSLDFEAYENERLPESAWWVAFGVVGLATYFMETAWLRLGMAWQHRPDWRWRRYDRVGYAVAHCLWFPTAVVLALWRAGAFSVS